MKSFENFIKSRTSIDDETLRQILVHSKERKIAKDRYVLKKGQISTEYIFVLSGGFRVLLENEDKHTTAWIALENEFFTDLISTRNQIPTLFSIQAIEDTSVLTIKHEKMEMLYKQFPSWQEFGRKIWEDAFLRVIDGLIEFQTLSAEQRYLNKMQQTEFLKRIPLKDLASFLGITQSSLSRLRKNIK